MKFRILLGLIAAVVLAGCNATPKRAASDFMNSLKDHKYAAAAECCGISKDQHSKQIQMAMLEEKYGMSDNSVRAFVITKDSVFPDKQNAIVTMNILYTDLHREDSVVLKMRKMDHKWIAQPFE